MLSTHRALPVVLHHVEDTLVAKAHMFAGLHYRVSVVCQANCAFFGISLRIVISLAVYTVNFAQFELLAIHFNHRVKHLQEMRVCCSVHIDCEIERLLDSCNLRIELNH